MVKQRPSDRRLENRLLASLPSADYARLAPKLEPVVLALKEYVHRPGEPIHHVYFPATGFFSELTVLSGGDMVEVLTIGKEGFSGVGAASEDAVVQSATMVQAEVETAYRLPAPAFRREMARNGAFNRLITRYAVALTGVVMQSTACNATHSLEQRLARWLLMARDRVGRDEFPLTQEFVAMMLGAARPTVTAVAGMLQKAGLIEYRRGHIHVLDAKALEAASCECYRAATNLLDGVTRGA